MSGELDRRREKNPPRAGEVGEVVVVVTGAGAGSL